MLMIYKLPDGGGVGVVDVDETVVSMTYFRMLIMMRMIMKIFVARYELCF